MCNTGYAETILQNYSSVYQKPRTTKFLRNTYIHIYSEMILFINLFIFIICPHVFVFIFDELNYFNIFYSNVTCSMQ